MQTKLQNKTIKKMKKIKAPVNVGPQMYRKQSSLPDLRARLRECLTGSLGGRSVVDVANLYSV